MILIAIFIIGLHPFDDLSDGEKSWNVSPPYAINWNNRGKTSKMCLNLMNAKGRTSLNISADGYIEGLYPKDDILDRVLEGIRQEGMPEISVPSGYGRLLTLLASMSGSKDALEIGALGGYSGICIARGLPEDGSLTSLEINADFAAVAERHVRMAGFGEKVKYRIGDAKESLQQLEEEGAKFDFFFIDADKGGYPAYLDMAIRLARPGALIIGDNILLKGKTAKPEANSPSVQAMRAFASTIANHPRLQSVILTAYDGLAIARVKA